MMEEDTGAKAPVTRLRRRLSVEQLEESKSPAPNTPTKRRAGRRTAKPELELIEENATSKTPQDKTKKTVPKDLIDTNEEKPVTPSRRSARIRSNTSLVSETNLTVDSPRAKRAARRLSQVGSDNEAPITPARQTRRTRKDSASSIDKVENQAATTQSSIIPEPIAEESESNNRKSITDEKDEKNTGITIRKSPRLMGKRDNCTFCISSEVENVDNLNTNVENTPNSSGNIEITGVRIEVEPLQTNTKNDDHADSKNETKVNKNERLSINSSDLLENMNVSPNKKTNSLNKSTSALENLISKNKRFRTKSYTSGTIITSNDRSTIFYSDNEGSEKNATNHARSPLHLLNKLELNKSQLNKSRKKDISLTNDSTTIAGRLSVCDEKNNSRQQNYTDEINSKAKIDSNENIFDKNPSADLQITVHIEDYDSNSEKLNRNEDDQRVPEVTHIIKSSSKCDISNTSKQNLNTTIEDIPEKNRMNDTCEPMDVDETIPDSLLIEDAGNRKENTSNQSFRKSNRKSSIMLSLNESGSQSKSTLILSHLKETSTSEKKKSPLKLDEKRLSNSTPVLNTTQDNIMHKTIKSLNYSTSTPLQQKSNEKGINLNNTNNSNNNTNNDLKITESKLRDSESDSDLSESENIKRKPKKVKSFSKKEETSSNNSKESNNESSQKNCISKDDEAIDAGDDYMSGDSQDEEERQKALDNEIRDKGETLSSEENFSNDSDYEKDSFVVSSAEEDELLEGTEDDLSMSDNELSISAKSKKKYNERKLKEQKRASREMFESRHQSNISKNSSVSDKKKQSKNIRQKSSSSESDIEIKKSSKVKNKQRLDSSHDIAMTNDEISRTSRRSKTPSQSICNESVTMDNEKEITISNQASTECDPLCQLIKEEPKTPRNSNTSMAFIDAHNEKTESSSKECENLDPLATTITNDDSSMSSDNERIVQEYDSILEGLNKTIQKLKHKTVDFSLNLEHKKNKKARNPIVDELNLTQVKTKKNKNKIDNPNKNNEEKIATNHSHISNDESSSSSESESVLLHLLFSEESNNCEDSSNKTKNEDKSKNVENKSDSPLNEALPKTPGSDKKKKKRQSESSQCAETNSPLNDALPKTPGSDKKKKKRQSESSQCEETNSSLNEALPKTPRSDKKKKKRLSESSQCEETNSSLNEALPKTPGSDKKKKKRQSESSQYEETNSSLNEALPKTLGSDKKKKKRQSESSQYEETNASDTALNESSKTPTSGKKKKLRKSESEAAGPEDLESKFFIDTEGTRTQDNSINYKSLNTSKMVVSDKANDSDAPMEIFFRKEKNSSYKIDEDAVQDAELAGEISFNQSMNKITGSSKKKKKKSLESQTATNESISIDQNHETNIESAKKKKNRDVLTNNVSICTENDNTDFAVNISNMKTPGSKKKKQKHSDVPTDEPDNCNVSLNKSKIQTPQSSKKNKQLPEEATEEMSTDNLSVNKSVHKTPQSGKKNRNKSQLEVEPSDKINVESEVNTSVKSSGSKKKQKRLSETSQSESNKFDNKPVINTIESAEKNSNDPEVQDIENKGKMDTKQPKNKKRKRNMSTNISEEGNDSHETEKINTSIFNKKKKVKLTNEGNDTETSKKNKNKKRKEREDDNDETSTKAFKENSLKKLKVSRLPTSLLEQLDEKPRKQRESPKKRVKLIATTNFIVEEIKKRRNKPSTFLEDSIYLNEDDNESKKNRANNFKPKVLPFVPTASTSINGYTSNFKVNVLPKDTKFVAQSSNIQNFKTDYLYSKKIKRIGTYELYKKSRNIKLAKY